VPYAGIEWVFDPLVEGNGPQEALISVSISRDDYPSGPFQLMWAGNAFVVLNSDGRLQLFEDDPELMMSSSVPLGQMFRVELLVRAGDPGEVELRLFNDADSTTPDETILVTDRSLTPVDFVAIGLINFPHGIAANAGTWWMDELEVSAP
jgi:hypothetical protein